MTKTLSDAINDIKEMVRSSTSGQGDPWLEIVNHCEPPGMVDMSYCEPVEEAVKKYISGISDDDKRSIWLGTEIGQMKQVKKRSRGCALRAVKKVEKWKVALDI